MFVDMGASHHQKNSNTYFLEIELGLVRTSIEPYTHFEPGYAAYRPRTRFMPFFVSDVSGQEAKMYRHGRTSLPVRLTRRSSSDSVRIRRSSWRRRSP